MITRTALRALTRRLIAGYPDFQGHRVVKRWGQDIGENDLPAIGVFTPMEDKRREAVDQYARITDLKVLIRRAGGDDLEDTLDAETEVLAELLVSDLNGDPDLIDCEMTSIETSIPGSGELRVGSALITFRTLQYTDEPG